MAKISIYDAAGSILNSFDQSLQDYARKQFDRGGIEVKLNRKPKSEWDTYVVGCMWHQALTFLSRPQR